MFLWAQPISYGTGLALAYLGGSLVTSHPEIRRHVCSWCKVKGWQQCTLYTPSVIAFSIKNVATSRPNPENCGSRSTCRGKASTVTSLVSQPLAGITRQLNAYANNKQPAQQVFQAKSQCMYKGLQ
jgi:hypothetical protein